MPSELHALTSSVLVPALVLALVLAGVARAERSAPGLVPLAGASAAVALSVACAALPMVHAVVLALALLALLATLRELNGRASLRPASLALAAGIAVVCMGLAWRLPQASFTADPLLVPAAILALCCAREALRSDFAPMRGLRGLGGLAGLLWAAAAVLPSLGLQSSLPAWLLGMCVVTLAAVLLRVETKLGRLGRIDPSSGLLNPLGLGEAIELEVARLKRSARPFSLGLVLAEVRTGNRFLPVLEGASLGEVARRIERVARAQDLLAHHGGGPFAVLLPDTHINAARAFAERLNRAVCHDPLGEAPLRLSIGLVGGAELAPRVLMARAELALEEAKRHVAATRVAVWLPPSGEAEDAQAVGAEAESASEASPLTRFLRPQRPQRASR